MIEHRADLTGSKLQKQSVIVEKLQLDRRLIIIKSLYPYLSHLKIKIIEFMVTV